MVSRKLLSFIPMQFLLMSKIYSCKADYLRNHHFTRGLTNAAPPTASPTLPIQRWEIGEAEFSVIGNNILDGKLQVKHAIGHNVDPSNVDVQLLDKNCENPTSDPGLEVSLEKIEYSNSPFVYNVSVNETLIGSSPGGFVTFINQEDTGKSKGFIKFCTRVVTREGNVAAAFKETIFKLNFDLTDKGFIFSTTLLEDSPDVFVTVIEDSFAVGVCQCDGDYVCYSSGSAPTIEQDESLTICLFPTANEDASVVHISNFNLQMSSKDGAYSYSPVSFGTATWSEDSLTDVYLQDDSDVIKISTPIVARFFIDGYEELDVSGEAYLEFDQTSKQENSASFSRFETMIKLQPRKLSGCFQNMFFRIRSSLFKL